MPAKSVMIGIQARSGSTRLPRKAFELIAGQTMLDRVISSCKSAAKYLDSWSSLKTRIAVLTPHGDPIATAFADRCEIVEGDEKDVLSRYAMAAAKYRPDLIVRVTGDCPLIPPYIISKLVKIASTANYDYLSNVDPRFRTTLDGADCEVISSSLLFETDEVARAPNDREHVTTWIRREAPKWAKIGCVVNHFDHSHLKLSVDTPEDLERVRRAFDEADQKHHAAIREYGKHAVHRI